jgi:tetratricopeptide (TPR) repeat protein
MRKGKTLLVHSILDFHRSAGLTRLRSLAKVRSMRPVGPPGAALIWIGIIGLSIAMAADSALAQLRGAEEDPPCAVGVLAAYSRHDSAQAIPLLESCLRQQPAWRSGWWLLGLQFYQAGKLAAAQTALERLLKLDPRAGAAWALLGLCDFDLGRFHQARQHLERGIALGIPAQFGLVEVARYHEALCLMKEGSFERAHQILAAMAASGPATEELTVALGLTALRRSMFPAAFLKAATAKEVSLVRKVGEAHSQAARSHQPQATSLMAGLIQGNPRVPNLHYAYGALLADQGEAEAAEEAFQAELKVTPLNVPARLGLLYLGMQNPSKQELLPIAKEVVRLAPRSPWGYYYWGRLLLRDGKLEEAAGKLEMARQLEPQSSQMRLPLMQVYRRMGRMADAAREQEAFLRLK